MELVTVRVLTTRREGPEGEPPTRGAIELSRINRSNCQASADLTHVAAEQGGLRSTTKTTDLFDEWIFVRVPRRVANFNSRVTNPLARAITPWLPGQGTLEHIGRKSGKRYRTPLLVFSTRDGFVFLVGYGPESDWLKNVLAGGATVLHKRGKAVALANPRLVSKAEAAKLVAPESRLFYRLFPYNEAALVLTKSAPPQ